MIPAVIRTAEDHDAKFILGEMARAEAAENKAREHYKAAGERLLAKKATLGHGNWLPWLKTSCIQPRKAQRCIAIATGKYDAVSYLPPELDPDPDVRRLAEKINAWVDCKRKIAEGTAAAVEIMAQTGKCICGCGEPQGECAVAIKIGRQFREAQQDLKASLKGGGAWEPWMAKVLWPEDSD